MKKWIGGIFAMTALVTLSTAANAAEVFNADELYFGAKGGIGTADETFLAADGDGALLVGAYAGAPLHIGKLEGFGVEVEAMASVVDGEFSDTFGNLEYSMLHTGAFATYRMSFSDNFKLKAKAGPTYWKVDYDSQFIADDDAVDLGIGVGITMYDHWEVEFTAMDPNLFGPDYGVLTVGFRF